MQRQLLTPSRAKGLTISALETEVKYLEETCSSQLLAHNPHAGPPMLPGDKSALAAASDDLSNSSYCWTVHRQSASTNRFLLAPPDDLYSPESSASEFGAANLSEQLAQSKNDSPATHLNNPSLAPDSEIMMWLFAGYRPPSHQTDAGIPADQLGSSSEATTGTGQGRMMI